MSEKAMYCANQSKRTVMLKNQDYAQKRSEGADYQPEILEQNIELSKTYTIA